mgnify:CR=1 FL=1
MAEHRITYGFTKADGFWLCRHSSEGAPHGYLCLQETQLGIPNEPAMMEAAKALAKRFTRKGNHVSIERDISWLQEAPNG